MDEYTEPSFCEKIQSLHNSLAQVQAESESLSELEQCHCFEKLGGLCGEVKVILDAMDALEKINGEGRRRGRNDEGEKSMENRVPDFEFNLGDECAEMSRNPMLNEVVLGRLFQVCEFGDLRRFRLVSKRWHNVSLSRWRNNAVVNIVSNHKHGKFSGRHHRNYLSRSSSATLHDIPAASTQPYRNFKLHYFQFPDNGPESRPGPPVEGECREWGRSNWVWESVEELDHFWSSIGHWMHHLNLYEAIIANGRLLRDTVVDKTPNLLSLKITKEDSRFAQSLPFENSDDKVHSNLDRVSVGYDGIPWTSLFKCFPNLKIIECRFALEKLKEFISAVNGLNLMTGRRGRPLELHCVTLASSPYYRYAVRALNLSTERDFMNQLLSSQHLRFCGASVHLDELIDESVLSNLYQSHSSSLQKLLLLRSKNFSGLIRNAFSIPLTSLTNLEITSSGIVPNLHFLEYTPNLRELKFNHIELRDLVVATDRTRMEMVQLGKLEKITFGGSSFPISELRESDLELIADLARNVRVFEGPLDNNSFWKLCGSWPQLRKLTVNSPSGKFDNFALTANLPGGLRLMPNITNLKYLQEFRTDSPMLSDDSIRNGFMQMSYLHSLRVTLSASTSDEAYLELWKRFRSIHVSRDEKSISLERRLNDKLKQQAQFLARDYDIC